ncbi:MAG: carbohydrate ABC transporter permease, partial [Cellulosilyticaceae bacterium]
MMAHKYKRILLFSINLVIGLIIIFPLLYALSLSLMTRGEMMQYPPNLIPKQVTFENYKQALQTVPLLKFIANSFIVASAVTIGQVITASLAAYSFSFFEFRGKKLLFIAVLATMMIPGEATIISNYLTVSAWGWNDSLKVLIIPFMTSAMGIFLMRQFYLTIPKELKQAAIIDGCGNFKLLIKIIMPISKPA